MALYHRATLTPSKGDVLAQWVPTQPWAPPMTTGVDVIGSFRFDDPDGRVGMETFLVRAGSGDDGGVVLQVPLTYRDAPLDGPGLITEMEHSALGTRWVYDGLADPQFVVMLAGVTMTGQGEALGMVVYDGRWYVAPTDVRIQGGGWGMERVPVDGFVATEDGVLENDRFRLTVHRLPVVGERPPVGLTATWPGQADPVLLASLEEL